MIKQTYSNLVSLAQLNRQELIALLTSAQQLREQVLLERRNLTCLAGHVVVNFFLEPSTRTQYSFTIAAQRLGAMALNPRLATSSLVKGESLLDTAQTFIAMGASALVVRHTQEHFSEQLASQLPQAAIINAGDGMHQHPTQGLLDLLTILQHKGTFDDLIIAVVGDIRHSRVANSLLDGLRCLGVKDIRLVAPQALLPENVENSSVTTSLAQGLADADVVVALRVQLERFAEASLLDKVEFNQQFGLTEQAMQAAKPDAIVMHPGPLNRGVEIDSAVADGPQSVILDQVSNGVAVRMAVLQHLLS